MESSLMGFPLSHNRLSGVPLHRLLEWGFPPIFLGQLSSSSYKSIQKGGVFQGHRTVSLTWMYGVNFCPGKIYDDWGYSVCLRGNKNYVSLMRAS